MSTLSPKGEALVRTGRRAYQPTAADRERLLNQLRAQLGDAALPSDMSSAASTAAASSSTWPIISAVVLGVGIVGGALFYAWPRATVHDHPSEVTGTPAPTPPQAEPVEVPATPPTAAAPATAPAVAPPAAASASHAKDRLAAEVALLARATRDLRAGRPADALKALDEYRRKFPKGLLGEEQSAARAQALCALGRLEEANTRLAELPPQSPLAVRAKQFCDSRSRR